MLVQIQNREMREEKTKKILRKERRKNAKKENLHKDVMYVLSTSSKNEQYWLKKL